MGQRFRGILKIIKGDALVIIILVFYATITHRAH